MTKEVTQHILTARMENTAETVGEKWAKGQPKKKIPKTEVTSIRRERKKEVQGSQYI